jgi:branched-chain amino acid transport system substrate-binding protein
MKWLLMLALTVFLLDAAHAQKIAFSDSLTGYGVLYGRPTLDGAILAAEEAHVTLDIHDDQSTEQGAIAAAKRIVASDVLVTIGPILTPTSLAAGPVYAAGGLASIVTTATGAGGPASPTTFRTMATTPELGAFNADYLSAVLGWKRATVLYRASGFGQQFVDGFKSRAGPLGIDVVYRPVTSVADATEAARVAAGDHERAVILGTLVEDSVPILITLRRGGIITPILGSTVMAGDAFSTLFADQSEGPAFFVDGIYAESPIMLDSANAETAAFADRFQARYHREATWVDVLGYDAARLAIAAVAASSTRAQVLAWLKKLDGPQRAVQTLAGPLWFGRRQAIRIGRFHGTMFESAPVQLIPVSTPDPGDIASGALVDLGSGRYARRQQVVYTGVFVNEIPRLDLAASTFTIDFYLWLRYAPGSADPSDIDFPDMVRGSFEASRPAARHDLEDGTTYRLWRVRGDFKNHFDLHSYPRDAQTLIVNMVNSRAALDHLVYVQDRRSPGGMEAHALRDLTQWTLSRMQERREVQVTQSAVGDPTLVGIERVRELSGYHVEVTVERRMFATLAKSLLPLGILTLIMFASLYFSDEGAKIAVAITSSLSGMVLLSSVNSQLGGVGYTIAVEYVFYMFLSLCLLCIVAVLASERLRGAELHRAAALMKQGTRVLFVSAVLATAAVAIIVDLRD